MTPRTLEQILGPDVSQQLVGLDLQYRAGKKTGSARIEVHYNRQGEVALVKLWGEYVEHRTLPEGVRG